MSNPISLTKLSLKKLQNLCDTRGIKYTKKPGTTRRLKRELIKSLLTSGTWPKPNKARSEPGIKKKNLKFNSAPQLSRKSFKKILEMDSLISSFTDLKIKSTVNSRKDLETIHDDLVSDIDDAIYSLKFMIGENEVRNKYIKSQFPDLDISHKFTMSGDWTETELFTNLDKIINNDKIINTFTVSSPTRFETDSHYIGFVMDKINKIIYILDPAYGDNGANYTADDEVEMVKSFVIYYDYNSIYVEPTRSACQILGPDGSQDTFCQSWSLWLIYMWVKYLTNKRKSRIAPIIKNERGFMIQKYNFFKIPKKQRTCSQNRLIKILKRDIFDKVLTFVNEPDNVLTSSGKGDIDLEVQYMIIRNSNPSSIKSYTKREYNDFYKSVLGKSLALYKTEKGKPMVKKYKNKIPKTRLDTTMEAYDILKHITVKDYIDTLPIDKSS